MNHESSARLPQGTWQTQITTRGLAGPQRKICAGARGSENSTRALERPGISCASASRHANNSLPSALSAPIEFAFGHSRYHVTGAPPPPTPAPMKKSYAQTIVGKRDLYPKTRGGATFNSRERNGAAGGLNATRTLSHVSGQRLICVLARAIEKQRERPLPNLFKEFAKSHTRLRNLPRRSDASAQSFASKCQPARVLWRRRTAWRRPQ